MNTQEREKLISFLQQLVQAQVSAKDVEAEKLIQEACSQQPAAFYLLVQRSLLLDQALQNSQQEVARLQKAQENSQAPSGSFFDNNAWGNSPAPAIASRQQLGATAYSPAAAPLSAAAPASSSFLNSGLLGTVASTAVGVVAGSFLYHGIENMMGNHASKSGLLSENTPPVSAPAEKLLASHDDVADNGMNDLDSLSLDDGDPDWV